MIKSKPTIRLALALIASLFLAGTVAAQNPLRPKTNSFEWESRIQQPSTVPVANEQPTQRFSNAPRRDQFTAQPLTGPKSDANSSIALMGYQSTIAPARQENPKATNRSKTNLIASTDKLPWRDPNHILDLIMKISLNLVFVLSFAFGAILLARRWIQPSGASRSTDRLGTDSLSVLQTLRIDTKSSIRLVQWRSNRFLIACDQNGIQSVNALNDSFDKTLTEMETEDQLVSKLLATMESNQQ